MARTTPRTGKPLPEPPAEPMKVNILDLSGPQVRRIERESGANLAQAPESAQLRAAAIVAAVYDVDLEVTSPLSMRELAKYVHVVEDEDDDPGNG